MERTVLIAIGLVAACIFEYFVSKKGKSGLILPIIFLIISVSKVLGIEAPESLSYADVLRIKIWLLTLYNIPTLILLTIYFAAKGREKA